MHRHMHACPHPHMPIVTLTHIQACLHTPSHVQHTHPGIHIHIQACMHTHTHTLTPTHTTQHTQAWTFLHAHADFLSQSHFSFYMPTLNSNDALWWKEQFPMTRSSNKEVSGRECGPSLWLPGLCALQLVNSSTDLGTRGCCSGMVDLHDLLSPPFSLNIQTHERFKKKAVY